MKNIVGIDAGGTKTECVLLSEKMEVIKSFRGKGFNLSVHGITVGCEVVKDLLHELKLSLDEKYQLNALCVAAAGAGRDELKTSFSKLLIDNLKDEYSFERLKVITDAEASLEGAFSGKPGFILIAGTGSILFGKDEKGNQLRCGGYGRIIGDGGSGYSIGRKAFTYLSKVLDCIEKGGVLSSKLSNKYNIKNANDLISLVNDPVFNLAEAAMTVLNAADQNDPSALKIIDDETENLCRLIEGIQNQTGKKKFNLALCGNLIANENIYSKTLIGKIARVFPEVSITKPEHSPAIGAAISVIKDM